MSRGDSTTSTTKRPTEAEYLAQEAERAKAAALRSLFRARDCVLHGADPRTWTARYPLTAVTSALVTGFVAGCVLIPGRTDTATRAAPGVLADVRRRLKDAWDRAYASFGPGFRDHNGRAAQSDTARVEREDGGPHPRDYRSGLLGTIAVELLRTVRPILTSMITASFAAHAGATTAAEAATEAAQASAERHSGGDDPPQP